MDPNPYKAPNCDGYAEERSKSKKLASFTAGEWMALVALVAVLLTILLHA